MRLRLKTAICLLSVLIQPLAAKATGFKIKTKEPIKKILKQRTISLQDWAKQINTDGFDLLCLGETHNDYFREFYSEKILSIVSANTLAIESRQEKADVIRNNYVENNEVPELLNARFDVVISEVMNLNSSVLVTGIERTQAESGEITRANIDQVTTKTDTIVSRDGFIASHLSDLMDEGKDRIIALYGAKHCAKFNTKGFGFDVPFYRQLLDEYSDSKKKMLAVHVIKRDERKNPLRLYAEEFGLIKDEDIVIYDTKNIDPKDYNYRQDILNMLNNYDVIILPKD